MWLSRGNETSTHKIDNKQHEDCARQYLNAINKKEKKKYFVYEKQHQSSRFKSIKSKKKKTSRNTKLDRPRMKHIVCATNRPIHHTACVHICDINIAKVLKLDQIKLPVTSLLHFQTSVFFFLDQFQ